MINLHAFPFNDANVQQSEERRNPGDLFLLAARDMLVGQTYAEHNCLDALKTYHNETGITGHVTTSEQIMQWLERDLKYEKKHYNAYPWWDGEYMYEWLAKATYWEQIGALVDVYYGSY